MLVGDILTVSIKVEQHVKETEKKVTVFSKNITSNGHKINANRRIKSILEVTSSKNITKSYKKITE